MKLLELRLTNFRSYQKIQRFKFPSEPGLYFLFGENQAEPRLEANAAGKSTIWDAMCWLLFGKTSRGLKAGEVANWKSPQGVVVELDYSLDDSEFPYTARRSWGPISWTLEDPNGVSHDLDSKDLGNLLYSHLKLGYEPFLHSVIMAQGQPMFLDLPAPKKAELFSSVMNLDKWVEYSQRASDMALDSMFLITEKEKEIASEKRSLETLGDFDFKEDSEKWEKQRADSLSVLDDRHHRLSKELKELRESKGPKLTTVQKSRKQINDNLLLLAIRNRELRAIQKQQADIIDEINKTQTALEIMQEQAEYLSSHNECSQCLQPISKIYGNQKTQHFAIQRKALERSLQGHNADLAALVDSEAGIEKLIKELESDIDTCKALVEKESRLLHQMDSIINSVNNNLDIIEADVLRIQKQINPYESKQQQAREKKTGLQEVITKLEAELDEDTLHWRRLGYWIKGFKDLRLSLIAEALQQLEIEVNSCLAQLGLMDWQLLFDVDRETKKGSIQRGFSVMVLSPSNSLAVPWEAWSGGESQRLRLAATMGLANLIKSSTGCDLNIEVWDEPTQWMSGVGVNDLLDSLAERARSTGKQIWIVDHRSLGYGGFDGIVTIKKTEAGSLIEQ